MENRDRDKLNRNSNDTNSDVNREASQRQDKVNEDSTADFGKKPSRDENLDEPSSRREEGVGSEGMRGDTGRSNIGEQESDIDRSSNRERGSNVERGRSGSTESNH